VLLDNPAALVAMAMPVIFLTVLISPPCDDGLDVIRFGRASKNKALRAVPCCLRLVLYGEGASDVSYKSSNWPQK
jgi:hypothetical protein